MSLRGQTDGAGHPRLSRIDDDRRCWGGSRRVRYGVLEFRSRPSFREKLAERVESIPIRSLLFHKGLLKASIICTSRNTLKQAALRSKCMSKVTEVVSGCASCF